MAQPLEDVEYFYIQDARSYVGNTVLWWRRGGAGYTTNLSEAMKVEKDWVGRPTDILRPCDFVDSIVTRTVDMQKLRS